MKALKKKVVEWEKSKKQRVVKELEEIDLRIHELFVHIPLGNISHEDKCELAKLEVRKDHMSKHKESTWWLKIWII